MLIPDKYSQVGRRTGGQQAMDRLYGVNAAYLTGPFLATMARALASANDRALALYGSCRWTQPGDNLGHK
jgi:hypothetical protein